MTLQLRGTKRQKHRDIISIRYFQTLSLRKSQVMVLTCLIRTTLSPGNIHMPIMSIYLKHMHRLPVYTALTVRTEKDVISHMETRRLMKYS